MTRSSTIPVSWSILSASVDLPWSMWAMMQKLRMRDGAVEAGAISLGRDAGTVLLCRTVSTSVVLVGLRKASRRGSDV